MPPHSSVERSVMDTDLSIKYTSEEDSFEVFMTEQMAGSCMIQDDDSSMTSTIPTNTNGSSKKKEVEKKTKTTTKKELRDFGIFRFIEGRRWNEVFDLLMMNEDLASLSLPHQYAKFCDHELTGNLVLHEVCQRQPPVEIVSLLLAMNPDAASAKGGWGYLPIHYACENRASYAVVQKLMMAYPSGIAIREDYSGMLPIHFACRKGAAVNVLELLVAMYPDAIHLRDGLAQLPSGYIGAIIDAEVRYHMVQVLEWGSTLCPTSNATRMRLEEGFEVRLREETATHQNKMRNSEARHQEELSRVTNEMLDAEFNALQLKEQLEYKTTELERFQEELIRLGDKQQEFIQFQQERQAQSDERDSKNQTEIELLTEKMRLYEILEKTYKSDIVSKEKTIESLKKQVENQTILHEAMLNTEHMHFQRLHLESLQREEKLKNEIAQLKKSNDMKLRLIQRTSKLAQEKNVATKRRMEDLMTRMNENCIEVVVDLATMRSVFSQEKGVRFADV